MAGGFVLIRHNIPIRERGHACSAVVPGHTGNGPAWPAVRHFRARTLQKARIQRWMLAHSKSGKQESDSKEWLDDVGPADLVEIFTQFPLEPENPEVSFSDFSRSREFLEDTLSDKDLIADPPGHKSGYAALIGRPNVGKSTLLNALTGEKLSIVSPKAQTTRHRVLALVSEPDFQLILLDTPGLVDHKRNHLETKMMGAVKSAMRDADSVVALVDVTKDREDMLAMLQPPKGKERPPMLVALNKIDLLKQAETKEAVAWWRKNCRCEKVLPLSALRGTGVKAVQDWMVQQLPEGPTLYPKHLASEHNDRFFVSEIIREHVFRQFDEEVPYAVQVNIAEFKERPKSKHYIKAVLVCETAGQQGILVGSRGSAMKALASAARVDIEEFLGHGVFLDMDVQVEAGWRKDKQKVKAFGYI